MKDFALEVVSRIDESLTKGAQDIQNLS